MTECIDVVVAFSLKKFVEGAEPDQLEQKWVKALVPRIRVQSAEQLRTRWVGRVERMLGDGGLELLGRVAPVLAQGIGDESVLDQSPAQGIGIRATAEVGRHVPVVG